MGCGNSRLGLDERHQLDEFRSSHGGLTDGNPSTKSLLRAAVVHDLDGSNCSRNSVSSFPPNPMTMDNIQIAADRAKEAEGYDETKKFRGENDNVGDMEANDEEDQGRLFNYGDSMFIEPPSFRMYCVDRGDDDPYSDDSVKDNGPAVNRGALGKIENEPILKDCTIASARSKEVGRVGRRSTKKWKRAGRGGFKKVFPMGKPASVKNLLNVSTCYNPSDPAHPNDRPRKSSPKPVA